MKNVLRKEEEELINYIKCNLDDCFKIGVSKVAKKNYTSAATLVRLAKNVVIQVIQI